MVTDTKITGISHNQHFLLILSFHIGYLLLHFQQILSRLRKILNISLRVFLRLKIYSIDSMNAIEIVKIANLSEHDFDHII